MSASASASASKYLQETGVCNLLSSFFTDLLGQNTLPSFPYPELLRRIRMMEGRRQEDQNDKKGSPPDLSLPTSLGVCCLKEDPAVWGLPQVLRGVDPSAVASLRSVQQAAERCLAAGSMSAAGKGHRVSVWVATLGDSVWSGRLLGPSLLWGPLQQSVEVNVEAAHFERAVDYFAAVVLADAHMAAGAGEHHESSQVGDILLQSVTISTPARRKGQQDMVRVWTPQDLSHSQDMFVREIKAGIPINAEISMDLFFAPCRDENSNMHSLAAFYRIHRTYTLHYRSHVGVKSFTRYPMRCLTRGIFFSKDEAQAYTSVYTEQSSTIASAIISEHQWLRQNVMSNMKSGDLVEAFASALRAALLVSGDDDKNDSLLRDIARVCGGAASEFRSFRYRCQTILGLAALLNRATDGSQPFKWWREQLRSEVWLWRSQLAREHLRADTFSDIMVLAPWVEQRLSLREHADVPTVPDYLLGGCDGATSDFVLRLTDVEVWAHAVYLSLAHDAAQMCSHTHVLARERQEEDLGILDSPSPPPALITALSWIMKLKAEEAEKDALSPARDKAPKKMLNTGLGGFFGIRSGHGTTQHTQGQGVTHEVTPELADLSLNLPDPLPVSVKATTLKTLQLSYIPESVAVEGCLFQYVIDHRLDSYPMRTLLNICLGPVPLTPFASWANSLAPLALQDCLGCHSPGCAEGLISPSTEMQCSSEPGAKVADSWAVWRLPGGSEHEPEACGSWPAIATVASAAAFWRLVDQVPHFPPIPSVPADSFINIELGCGICGSTLLGLTAERDPSALEVSVPFFVDFSIADQDAAALDLFAYFIISTGLKWAAASDWADVWVATGQGADRWGGGTQRTRIAETVTESEKTVRDRLSAVLTAAPFSGPISIQTLIQLKSGGAPTSVVPLLVHFLYVSLGPRRVRIHPSHCPPSLAFEAVYDGEATAQLILEEVLERTGGENSIRLYRERLTELISENLASGSFLDASRHKLRETAMAAHAEDRGTSAALSWRKQKEETGRMLGSLAHVLERTRSAFSVLGMMLTSHDVRATDTKITASRPIFCQTRAALVLLAGVIAKHQQPLRFEGTLEALRGKAHILKQMLGSPQDRLALQQLIQGMTALLGIVQMAVEKDLQAA